MTNSGRSSVRVGIFTVRNENGSPVTIHQEQSVRNALNYLRQSSTAREVLDKIDLLRKYPEDLQFPNEIRKPNPKKRQGIQTAYRCNARPFSRNAANHHRSRKPEGQVRQAAYARFGRPTAAYPKLSAPLPYPTRIGRHLRPFRK